MRPRCTKFQARQHIADINEKLQKLGETRLLSMTGRNGYQGLDISENGTCLRTITCGTPRACLEAAFHYFANVAYNLHFSK